MAYKEKTSMFVRLEKEGDTVEGVYLGNEALTLNNGNTAYRHTVRSADGDVSFLGGTVLDQMLGDIAIGTQVLIERTGTIQTQAHRSMKQFKVSVWEGDLSSQNLNELNINGDVPF